jgi:hypothetical protein
MCICLLLRGTSPPKRSHEWLIGEALTNLYVGLSREARGEKLSAMRFIQGYAVDRIVELSEKIEEAGAMRRDPFSLERRYEARFPGIAQLLSQFLQGYDRNRESALAILFFLDQNFEINPRMKGEISRLCQN